MRRQHREEDARVDVVALVEDGRAKAAEPKPASALPADRLRNAALLAIHDLLQARHAMRHVVLAQLNPNPAPSHLVRHRRRRQSQGTSRAPSRRGLLRLEELERSVSPALVWRKPLLR